MVPIVLLDEGLHELQFVKIKGPQYLWSTIKWSAIEQDTPIKVWKIVTTEKRIRYIKVWKIVTTKKSITYIKDWIWKRKWYSF